MRGFRSRARRPRPHLSGRARASGGLAPFRSAYEGPAALGGRSIAPAARLRRPDLPEAARAPCPHDRCWRSWTNATQMPAVIARLTSCHRKGDVGVAALQLESGAHRRAEVRALRIPQRCVCPTTRSLISWPAQEAALGRLAGLLTELHVRDAGDGVDLRKLGVGLVADRGDPCDAAVVVVSVQLVGGLLVRRHGPVAVELVAVAVVVRRSPLRVEHVEVGGVGELAAVLGGEAGGAALLVRGVVGRARAERGVARGVGEDRVPPLRVPSALEHRAGRRCEKSPT